MKYYNVFELNSTFETASSFDGTLDYPNMSVVQETNNIHILLSKPELYEWVDLGLQSGLKWAAWNVGATKPEEFGLYFAWGETEGYTGITDTKKFTWSDYELCNGSDTTLIKYNSDSSKGTVDNLTTLEHIDDAAYQSDDRCRMPTKEELEELTTNTTSIWETLNGVAGRRFTSKINDNSIFIPAAGYCYLSSVRDVGSNSNLWCSTINANSNYSSFLYFNSDDVNMNGIRRCSGLIVRPVKD